MKKLMKFLVGPSISLVIIVWILSKTDFSRLSALLLTFHWKYIIVLVGIYLLGFLLRGLRWQIMLRPVKIVSLGSSTAIIIIGYMANNLLPARLGEIVRALALNRHEGISKTCSLSSIFFERVFDGLALLAIFVLTAAFVPSNPEYQPIIHKIGLTASAIFLFCLAGIILVRIWPSLPENIILRAKFIPARIRERIVPLCRSVLEAMEFLKLDARLVLFLILSLGVWTVEGGMYWAGMYAFGLPTDPLFAYFTLALVNFGILIPSAPGNVGLFHGCVIIAFAVFSINRDVALGYAIVVHALQYIPITLLGLIFANGMSLRWRKLDE
ncbi:MAG: flippase-like domain-containing protein [Deltaproteobacteria bacterium]|nr:flippase-like domain-containing protein [Deltaproteobacteria bacterium]